MRWMVLLLWCASCVRGGAGTRCVGVCHAEAECAEKLELGDNDFVGCVQSCTELERDPHTTKMVEEHIKCVAAANGVCANALDCR
jgi:hypothetical protein